MKTTMLLMVMFLQFAFCNPVRATIHGGARTGVVQAQLAPPLALLQAQPSPMGDKGVDVNITMHDQAGPRRWYAQPIWIAVFVLGGISVLTLLALALRGSGSGGTIVKG